MPRADLAVGSCKSGGDELLGPDFVRTILEADLAKGQRVDAHHRRKDDLAIIGRSVSRVSECQSGVLGA